MMNATKRWILLSVVAGSVFGAPVTDSTAQTKFPFPRSDPEDFVEITAGNNHTCARKFKGDVYCWGRTDLGQVGSGSDGPGAIEDRARLVMRGANQLDAGGDHTCAISIAGVGFCWGSNQWGALGANNTMALQQAGGADHWSTPIAIDGGLTFISLSGGVQSTCGTATTGLFCWGKLMTAPFGAGTPSPVMVTSWNGYSRASVGSQHACVIYYNGWTREAHCFGDGSKGQTALDPNSIFLGGLPSQTMFGGSVSRVVTQADFTCVDDTNTTVSCAGDNLFGQLGNGSVGVPLSTPHPQLVGNGISLRGVTTGTSHACALDLNGAALCWGSAGSGRLGTGTNTTGAPQPVRGGLRFRAIAAGASHTCGIATTNQIYCWGSNTHGQLGIGRRPNPNFFTEPSPWDPVQF